MTHFSTIIRENIETLASRAYAYSMPFHTFSELIGEWRCGKFRVIGFAPDLYNMNGYEVTYTNNHGDVISARFRAMEDNTLVFIDLEIIE